MKSFKLIVGNILFETKPKQIAKIIVIENVIFFNPDNISETKKIEEIGEAIVKYTEFDYIIPEIYDGEIDGIENLDLDFYLKLM